MWAASRRGGSGSPDNAQRPLYAVITASRNDAWWSRCLTARSAYRRSSAFLRWFQGLLIRVAECDARLQCRGVPTGNESGEHGLVAAGRDAQEVDDRYLVLECLAKPPIVGGFRVLSHESIINRLVAIENLPVDLAGRHTKLCHLASGKPF
jgi:hypothetical protein